MPHQIDGLPTHVLLVHAVVVLVPLAALLLVLSAVWPAFQRRAGIAVPVLALVALVCVPITTNAGGWLIRRVPRSELVHEHAELGDSLLPWAIGLFAAAAVGWALAFWARRSAPSTEDGPAPRRPLLLGARVLVGVLAIVVAAGAVVQVYRIGDSGAKAAWTGRVATSARGGPGGDGD